MTRRNRLTTAAAAGATTLALVGGLAACGGANAKVSAHNAAENLKNSKTASFTLHLSDPNGELAKSATSASDKKTAKILGDSALRITVDPPGNTTMGQITSKTGGNTKDVAAALKASGAVEIAYVHSGKDVVDFRMVDGVDYAKIDPAQYQAISGSPLPLDQLAGPGAPPALTNVVDGIKAGKWLSLDLADVYSRAKKQGLLDKITQAQKGSTNSIDPEKARALGNDMLGVVKANTVTTQGAGANKTVDVKVSIKAKAALLGAIDVLAKPEYKSLLGAGGKLTSTALTSARTQINMLPDGPVTGTVTTKDDHVTKVAVNLASIAALSKDAQAKKDITTSQLVLDVNDSAPAVQSPASNHVVQLDQLVDTALAQAKKSLNAMQNPQMLGTPKRPTS